MIPVDTVKFLCLKLLWSVGKCRSRSLELQSEAYPLFLAITILNSFLISSDLRPRLDKQPVSLCVHHPIPILKRPHSVQLLPFNLSDLSSAQ